ncbi:DUF6364 family protein [Endozoicomonas sp. Mp262]|uniref:DUF6364 family protein n=1 Tax=Endozoicomonas sp. Mp262 TaxID=2919499 RepID=UPI0021D81A9E
MQKLTLRMQPELIDHAKQYAAHHGKSLSQLVADYFEALTKEAYHSGSLPPLTRKLRGLLKDASDCEQDYKQHLEDKYL